MSIDQYAKLIASVAGGAVMPKEYWTLMTQSADTHGYGYALASVPSDHAKVKAVGRYYTHNGGDGNLKLKIAGGGFWIAWGSRTMAFRLNSPLKGSYGVVSSTQDNSLLNLCNAVDAALNAALT